MDNKKVSIIIPCFNCEKFIAETLDSALAQTYNNIEIVIIDDCSTDNSAEIIDSYVQKHDNIIFLKNEENKGVIFSRNRAIKTATGEYILPLDADDKIAPTYIEKASKILDEKPEIGIVYCKANLFGAKNKKWNLPEYNEFKIKYENIIFVSSLFRKSDFEKVGGYKEYMKCGYEDWDLWLSFIERGIKPYQIPEVLFFYRKHKQPSRDAFCQQNKTEMLKQIFKNHFKLYFEDKKFISTYFETEKLDEINKKYGKYKKLFYTLIAITIIEFITICALVFIK